MARRRAEQWTVGGAMGMVAAVAVVAALSSSAKADSILLSGGSSISTLNSRTLEYVLVTGTDGSGSPSTYTASQTGEGHLLTITDSGASVTLSDFGVMVANIAVDASGRADIHSGGMLFVNRAATFAGGISIASGGSVQIGTFGSLNTAGSDLSLFGANALVRTGGGTYATGNLSLGSEATATFGSGDVMTGNATLTGTSSMVIQSPLSSGGWADVSEGSTLTVDAATTFAQGVFASNGGKLAISPSGSVTTPNGVLVYLAGADSFSRSAGGIYSAGILSIADLATVDFVNGDTVSGDVLVDRIATLDIQAPLATTGDVWVTNGASLSRTTATVSAGTLFVGGSSAVQTIAGDALDAVSVTAGGDVAIAAPLGLSTLSISGDDGSGNISTATIGDALTIANGGSVQVSSGGRLEVAALLAVASGGSAAISVTGAAADGTASVLRVASAVDGFSSINIASGATLDLDGGSVAASVLSFSGSSAFARSVGNYTIGTLYLDDSAAVSYNSGDSIATGVALLSGATLDLRQNLLLSDSLTLGDNVSITRTNATIAVPSVTVAGLSALALGTGDSVESLSLSGGGQVSSSTALVLDGSTPLTIGDAGSLLTLSAFDGLVTSTTIDARYALRVYGDQQALLTSYLSDGRIVLGSSPHTPVVLYNPTLYGNVTYIAYVVPEPSTMVIVLCSLATFPFIRRRRG